MHLQNGVDLVGKYFHFTKDSLMRNHILPLRKVCYAPSNFYIIIYVMSYKLCGLYRIKLMQMISIRKIWPTKLMAYIRESSPFPHTWYFKTVKKLLHMLAPSNFTISQHILTAFKISLIMIFEEQSFTDRSNLKSVKV